MQSFVVLVICALIALIGFPVAVVYLHGRRDRRRNRSAGRRKTRKIDIGARPRD
jgi:hypothetical protein